MRDDVCGGHEGSKEMEAMLLVYRREGSSFRVELPCKDLWVLALTGFGDWLNSQISGWVTGCLMLPPTKYGNTGEKSLGLWAPHYQINLHQTPFSLCNSQDQESIVTLFCTAKQILIFLFWCPENLFWHSTIWYLLLPWSPLDYKPFKGWEHIT